MRKLLLTLSLLAALLLTPAQTLAVDDGTSADGTIELGSQELLDQLGGAIQGTFLETEFYSPAVDNVLPYFIYLPPGYETAAERYPVLYMLHGGGGDKAEWVSYGLIHRVDELIARGQIRPMIVVLPQGFSYYWVNHVDGPRWGDYVARDLVAEVDRGFRTLSAPRHRAIGGLSMGAHAALQLSFSYPGVFGTAGAHSPSLRTEEQAAELEHILGTGEEYARRDPISLAAGTPDLDQLNIWIDVGSQDTWLPRAQALHETLLARGVTHEWHVGQGDHDVDYWGPNLGVYVRTYDRYLNGSAS